MRSRAVRFASVFGFVRLYPRFPSTIRAATRGYLAIALAASLAACEQPLGPAQDSAFSIDLRYWDAPPTEEQRARIESAVARWERLIVRGLTPALVTGDAGCGPESPPIEEEVDDIVVFVRVIDIEALAESGPCKLRAAERLPITATVWLDGPTRLAQLAPEFLESLVTHELGHALGFGTVWDDKSLLREPSLTGGAEPHFSGQNARAEFDAIGGLTFSGKKVPVEFRGGPGTADSHWRDFVFGDRELMSAIVLLGENPLSRVTAASMIDLGYEVDLAQADDYVLPGAASLHVAPRNATPEVPRLTESRPRWSMSLTDRTGRIVRRDR